MFGPVRLHVNLVLLLLLLASSFWLVRTSNEARSLFVALNKAEAQAKELSVEHDRLQAERRQAAAPLVVERLVRGRLKMANVRPDVTYYVKDPVAVAGGTP